MYEEGTCKGCKQGREDINTAGPHQGYCQECREFRLARRRGRGSLRDQIRRDLGLVKVRGNLGGTFWE